MCKEASPFSKLKDALIKLMDFIDIIPERELFYMIKDELSN